MFQWETHVSLGVLLVLIIVIIVPRSVFTKSSSIKLYKEDKRLLFNSDPWPPAEQKLEMPCDIYIKYMFIEEKEKANIRPVGFSVVTSLAPPPGSKFFQFHAAFGNIWQNRMLAPP